MLCPFFVYAFFFTPPIPLLILIHLKWNTKYTVWEGRGSTEISTHMSASRKSVPAFAMVWLPGKDPEACSTHNLSLDVKRWMFPNNAQALQKYSRVRLGLDVFLPVKTMHKHTVYLDIDLWSHNIINVDRTVLLSFAQMLPSISRHIMLRSTNFPWRIRLGPQAIHFFPKK